MSVQELEECLHLLVGDRNFKTALPNDITSDQFAENVLGFEEVDEVEEDGEEYAPQEALGASYGVGMSSGYQMHNDVIPEEDF